METIDVIRNDMLSVLDPVKLVTSLELPDSPDPTEQVTNWLHAQRDLRGALARELGRLTLREILSKAGVPFDGKSSAEALVDEWFANREMATLVPSARPQEMASTITELANQIRATPDKFDSLDVLLNRCRLLLRYMLFFYGQELMTNDALQRIVRDAEQVELEDLCCLAACDEALRREPYNPLSAKSVRLADEPIRGLLHALPALAREVVENERTQRAKHVSDCVLALVEGWRPTPQASLIPKGAVFGEVSRGGFGGGGDCYDELGASLSVDGIRADIRKGDNVLLAMTDETEIRAPQLRPLPSGEAWITPGRTSCGLPDRPRPVARRRLFNQVFISYAREDSAWADRVRSYLRPFVDQKVITVWDDSRIEAGERWRDKIKGALSTSGIAVMVLSEDFFKSEFIMSTELPVLLKASRDEDVRLFLIYATPSPAQLYPDLADVQGVGTPDRPLTTLAKEEQHEVLLKLACAVRDHCRK